MTQDKITFDQAVKDTRELWLYIWKAKLIPWSGNVRMDAYDLKQQVIKQLYRMGLVSRFWYVMACPLCEYAAIRIFSCEGKLVFEDIDCGKCPWPKYSYTEYDTRCSSMDSPWGKWLLDKDNAYQYAKEIYDMTFDWAN